MPDTDTTTPAAPDDLDRRVRLYHVGQNLVFDLIAGVGAGLPEYVTVPRFHLPPGARLVGSPYHDFYSGSFVFVVQHPSFDPVPEGHVLPRADAPTRYEVVRLAVATQASDPDAPAVVHANAEAS